MGCFGTPGDISGDTGATPGDVRPSLFPSVSGNGDNFDGLHVHEVIRVEGEREREKERGREREKGREKERHVELQQYLWASPQLLFMPGSKGHTAMILTCISFPFH